MVTIDTYLKKLGKKKQVYADLIKGWVPKQNITIIAGEQESGKSTLSVEMAYCVATGESFAGYEVTEAAPVLYLNYGSPEHSIFYRLFAFCAGHEQEDKEDIPVAVLTRGDPDLPYTRDCAFAEKIITYLKECAEESGDDRWLRPGMIVVDSLLSSINFGWNESENDADIITEAIDNIQNLINNLNSNSGAGTAVLITHYPVTNDDFQKIETITQDSLIGGYACFHNVANIFYLMKDKKNPEIRRFKCLKNMGNPNWESEIIKLKLISHIGYSEYFNKETYVSSRFVIAQDKIPSSIKKAKKVESKKSKRSKRILSTDEIVEELVPIYAEVLAAKKVATLSEMRDIVTKNYKNKPAYFWVTPEISHLCCDELIRTGVAKKTPEQPRNGIRLQFCG